MAYGTTLLGILGSDAAAPISGEFAGVNAVNQNFVSNNQDGTGEFLSTLGVAKLTQFFWLNTKSLSSSGGSQVIIDHRYGSDFAQRLTLGDSSLELAYVSDVPMTYEFNYNFIFSDDTYYHIRLDYDTTQATAADRIRLEINGAPQTPTGSPSYPSLNDVLGINNGRETARYYIGWGSANGNSRNPLECLLHQFGIIVGSNPASNAVYNNGYVETVDIEGLANLKSLILSEFTPATNVLNNGVIWDQDLVNVTTSNEVPS